MTSTVVGTGRRTTSPYPRYRKSGVEWLGEVPEHWEVKRLSLIGSFFKGSGGTKEDEVEDGVPCVRYGDIYTQHRYFIRDTRGHISEESAASYTPIRYGDILFAGSGETIEEIGKSAANLIEGLAYCGGDVIVLRPAIEANATFLGYAADCSTSMYQKACMGRGVTVMHIYSQELGHLLLPLPPVAEQRAIGAYLDRETERIDALVVKMRLLIERLGEYRSALLTRTVTRGLTAEAARAAGLDPSPRLKPSGVEWLGEVPEHWEVKRLKFVVSINDESLSEDEEPLRPMAYVDIGSVNPTQGITHVEEMFFEDAPSRARRLVKTGDTIVSTVRTYLGAIAPVTDPLPEMVVSTGFAVIRPRKVHACFAAWVLRERRIVESIVARSTGVSYPAINAPTIGELFVPLPPVAEQRVIGAYLDRETERIDALAVKMRLLIERLGEYRSALITAAVTGKIDVRGAVESHEARSGGQLR